MSTLLEDAYMFLYVVEDLGEGRRACEQVNEFSLTNPIALNMTHLKGKLPMFKGIILPCKKKKGGQKPIVDF